MKTKLLCILLGAWLLGFHQVHAQGTTCASATPFCSNGLNPYAAGVNNPSAPIGNNYDCLFTQPNPAWFYLNITSNGDLNFTLDNTSNVDIDFILWGPFPNLGAAIGACGNLGNGGASGAIADCSYSAQAVEPVSVTGVLAGEVYILMVTNFSNQPTNIFATSNSGSGDYACDCSTEASFGLAPTGFNDGFLLDTTAYSADFIVCSGGTLGFTIDLRSDSIVDSLGVYLPNTTIGSVFDPTDITVFGPIYPVPGRYDTAQFFIFIRTNDNYVGINDFVFSILNSGCVQDLAIRVIVPGVEVQTNDSTICPGYADTLQLYANGFVDSISSGIGFQTYQWTHIGGFLTALSNDTIKNPLLYIPAGTQFGDSIVYQIVYSVAIDTVTCSYVDTLIIRADAASLSVTGDTSICAGQSTLISANFYSGLTGLTGVCGSSNALCDGPLNLLTVGTNNATTSSPFDGFWEDSKTQMIIRASELIAAGVQPGLLRELSLNVVLKGSTAPYNGFSIALSCTNLNDFSPAFPPPNFVNGLTQVYSGNYSTTMGWNVFPFSTAYEWDGISNIIVQFCYNNTAWTSSDDVQAMNTTWNSMLEFSADGTSGCTETSPFNTNNVRPVVRFRNCTLAPPISYAWTPNAGFVSGSPSSDSALVAPFTTTNYLLTATDGRCTYRDSVLVTLISSMQAPIISCDSLTTSSIRFAWSSLPAAANYQYSLDAGQSWVNTNDTFLLLTGLNPNTSRTIWVRGVASSGVCLLGEIGMQTCSSLQGCNNPFATFQVSQNTFCVGSNAYVILTGASAGTLPFAVELIGFGLVDTAFAVGDTLFWNLPEDQYGVQITDLSTGCQSTTNMAFSVRFEGNEILFDFDFNGQVNCTNDGGLDILTRVFQGTPFSYLWSSGATTSSINNVGPGQYIVTVSDSTGTCMHFDTINVLPRKVPQLNAWIGQLGQDSVCIYQGEQTILNAGLNDSTVIYSWSPITNLGSPNNSTTNVTATDVGNIVYTIRAMSIDSCFATDELILCVHPATFIGMPTAFTPNGDGDNDFFRPAVLSGATVTRFEVYTRWGLKVFDSIDTSIGWDGKFNELPQPRDVYMYVLEYKLPSDAKPTLMRGAFTLLR